MFWIRALILFLIYPFLKRKYGIKIAKTQFEKEQVFKFRYQIYRVEMDLSFFDKTSANKMIYDEYDFSDDAIILYAGDIHNIIGTVRITEWENKKLCQKFIEKYGIHSSVLNKTKVTAQIRYFQVCKAYRRSLLGITLLSALYEFTTKSETVPLCDIMFCDCQPGLFRKYEKVGSFSYTHKMLYKEYGFLEIPIALAPFDFKYLKKVGAVHYLIIKYFFYFYKKSTSQEDIARKTQDFTSVLPHLNLHANTKSLMSYRKNMDNEKTRVQFKEIISLIKETVILSLDPDTVIIKKDFNDFDLFIVLEGKIGVYLKQTLIAELKPGALLGEMAFIDTAHKRFTDVKSITQSKVLLIPRGFLIKLQKKNPHAAYQFLLILCNSLLDKLDASNKAFRNLNPTKSNLIHIEDENNRIDERKQIQCHRLNRLESSRKAQ